MGRTAKVTSDTSFIAGITEQKLELGSRLMCATGMAIMTYGVSTAVMVGVDKNVVNDPKQWNPPWWSPNPIHVGWNIGRVINARSRVITKKVHDLAKPIIDRVLGNRKKRQESTNDTQRAMLDDQIAKDESILDPYLQAIQLIQIGTAMVTAGFAFYMMSHPDILKEAIKAMKDIAVRAIDEISEAGDALAKIIDQLMPSILELI